MKKLIFILLLVFIPSISFSEIVWQDNFNGFTSGWTPSVSGAYATLYPWTTDQTFDPEDPADDGGGNIITNYEPSIYPANQRTNSNSWNGWVQSSSGGGTVSIQPTGGVDNSPVYRIRLSKYAGLSHEIGLHKWLGNVNYQELYIQYKVKFGTTGEDFWWNGSWSDGGPVDGGNLGIIWKFGRVWTGFNPTDYDKTGGQSQPVENTTWTDESNWRSGIWIFRWMAQNPTDTVIDNSTYFDVSNFYAPVSCTPPSPTCDSQSPARDPDTGNQWDWLSSLPGHTKTIFNGGNPLGNDGTFSQAQTFHTIEMYFKNRSNPSTADGDMRIWVDGVEITESATISPPILASMSADEDDYGMNFIRFGDNYNNLTLNIPDDPGYMDVFIDDIIISTTYIGEGEEEEDTTPPVITNTSSSSFSCSEDPLSFSITATSDEPATFKWSLTDQAYDSMENTMDGTGTTSHSDTVSQACGTTEVYYVRASDADGNKSASSTEITVTVSESGGVAMKVGTTGNAINVGTTGNPIRVEMKFFVAYNENDADSGTAPSDEDSYYSNELFTVLGNTGNMVKALKIFDGWNTAADGSGTAYSAGSQYPIYRDMLLYAQFVDPYSDLSLNTPSAPVLSSVTATVIGEIISAPAPALNIPAAPTKTISTLVE